MYSKINVSRMLKYLIIWNKTVAVRQRSLVYNTYVVCGEDDRLQQLDVEGGDDDIGERVEHPLLAELLPDQGPEVLAVVLGAPRRGDASSEAAPPLREDARAVLEVEGVDTVGGEARAPVLPRRGQHRRDEPAGARPGDVVEVVRQPRRPPVQVLQPGLEEGEHRARDEAPDAATVDGQDRHPVTHHGARLRRRLAATAWVVEDTTTLVGWMAPPPPPRFLSFVFVQLPRRANNHRPVKVYIQRGSRGGKAHLPTTTTKRKHGSC